MPKRGLLTDVDRGTLAQQLHDTAAQHIPAALLLVEVLRKDLHGSNAVQLCDELGRHLANAGNDIRAILDALEPTVTTKDKRSKR